MFWVYSMVSAFNITCHGWPAVSSNDLKVLRVFHAQCLRTRYEQKLRSRHSSVLIVADGN